MKLEIHDVCYSEKQAPAIKASLQHNFRDYQNLISGIEERFLSDHKYLESATTLKKQNSCRWGGRLQGLLTLKKHITGVTLTG